MSKVYMEHSGLRSKIGKKNNSKECTTEEKKKGMDRIDKINRKY